MLLVLDYIDAMKRLIVLALIALSACTKHAAIPSRDGRQAYLVECRGAALSWTDCYKKAAELCPAGYDVTEKDSGHEAQGNLAFSQGTGGMHNELGMDRSLSVSCR